MALQKLLPILRTSPHVIIESNSILKFLQPDVFIMVLRFDIEDFKASAQETLKRADAALAVNFGSMPSAWKGMFIEALARMPVFHTTDPKIIPQELSDFVRARLRFQS